MCKGVAWEPSRFFRRHLVLPLQSFLFSSEKGGGSACRTSTWVCICIVPVLDSGINRKNISSLSLFMYKNYRIFLPFIKFAKNIPKSVLLWFEMWLLLETFADFPVTIRESPSHERFCEVFLWKWGLPQSPLFSFHFYFLNLQCNILSLAFGPTFNDREGFFSFSTLKWGLIDYTVMTIRLRRICGYLSYISDSACSDSQKLSEKNSKCWREPLTE
jgi:hypothetical protein